MSVKTTHIRCTSCKTVNAVPVHKLKDHPLCGKCKKPIEFPRTPVNIKNATFQAEVLEWAGAVIIDFWAAWCGACRMIEPALNALAQERAGTLKVAKVNVDEEPDLARNFHIKATPTLVLYHKGRKVKEVSGALSKEQLEGWLDYPA